MASYLDWHQHSEYVQRLVANRGFSQFETQTLCEASFALQELYAKPYNLSMNDVYYNISKIEEINNDFEHNIYAGTCSSKVPDDKRDSYIKIDYKQDPIGGFSSQDGSDARRSVLFHEVTHAMSAEWKSYKGVAYIERFGIDTDFVGSSNVNFINEIVAEGMSCDLQEFWGYKPNRTTYRVEGNFVPGKCAMQYNASFGYSQVGFFYDTIKSMYREEMAREMIAGETALSDAISSKRQSIETNLSEIWKGTGDQIELSSRVTRDFVSLYADKDKARDFGIDEYIADTRGLSKSLPTLQNQYNQPENIATAALNNIYIRDLISNIRPGLVSSDDYRAETRSLEVSAYLAMMNAVREDPDMLNLSDAKFQITMSAPEVFNIHIKEGQADYLVCAIINKEGVNVADFYQCMEREPFLQSAPVFDFEPHRAERGKAEQQLSVPSFYELCKENTITGSQQYIYETTDDPQRKIIAGLLSNNNVPNVHRLVNSGVDIGIRDAYGNNIMHALGINSSTSVDVAKACVSKLEGKKTVDVLQDLLNQKNAFGETPVQVAVNNGNRELFDLFVSTGIPQSLTAPRWGDIISNERANICAMYMEAGAMPSKEYAGGVAVILMSDDYDQHKELIDKIIDTYGINELRHEGYTLLQCGLSENIPDECFQDMLERGADPNIKTVGGFTALHIAAQVYEDEDISDSKISNLFQHGANSAERDDQGRTFAEILENVSDKSEYLQTVESYLRGTYSTDLEGPYEF